LEDRQEFAGPDRAALDQGQCAAEIGQQESERARKIKSVIQS